MAAATLTVPDAPDPSVLGGKLLRLGYRNYEEYLVSGHWQELRGRYRASNRPQRCACGRRGTQLHHLTYDRLGVELLSDLLMLCASCHRRAHGAHHGHRITTRDDRRKPEKRLRLPPLHPSFLRSLPGTPVQDDRVREEWRARRAAQIAEYRELHPPTTNHRRKK